MLCQTDLPTENRTTPCHVERQIIGGGISNQGILKGFFTQNDGDMNAVVKLEGTLGRQIPNMW